MYYYKRLKDIRDSYDLSQLDLSILLKITNRQYSLYERGKRELPIHLLIILSMYYNVSADYLIGISDRMRTVDGDEIKNIAEHIRRCRKLRETRED